MNYKVTVQVEAPLNFQHPQKLSGHAHAVIKISNGLFMSKSEANQMAKQLAEQAEKDPYFKSYEILDETL